ncbi:hypothetical protein DFA_02390 [Cavenderia fasciculata]|uniref:F-box domain-containing protein n=1 Tax=Cavenderia fasciculata TaxID=261658 RepID=F4PZB4_CACFS|nr:uncharacterized protein DFA_02390 [Cavenderia fasciculata]EGG19143.1 hypothetical protein DFA_02390 [Cavenderia fasciculata]|eukprot:XP_004366776.1 hypothetical protein DFA_02390 [Cavenderia fasciculata]
MTCLLSLSNLLLLHIISEIEDNVDIICLLLTCKKLYSSKNSSLKRLIRFKGIEVIDTDKTGILLQFIATVSRFNLNSFKDILDNSISYQHIALFDQRCYNDYPKWIHDHIGAINIVDKSNITTALVYYDDNTSKSIESLYEISSIETLFINYSELRTMYLGSQDLSRLPNLQRLEVCGWRVDMDHHSSLKTLVIDVQQDERDGLDQLSYEIDKFVSLKELTFKMFLNNDSLNLHLLPSSLSSLTLRLSFIPEHDTFISLTSLVNFNIYIENFQEDEDGLFINLDGLTSLETFKFEERESLTLGYIVKISLPLSIKILTLRSSFIKISSESVLPMLEKLYAYQNLLIDDNISLSSSPLLKKLVIDYCVETITANLIPTTIEKLKIYKETQDKDILGQIVFPPNLTHLSILGEDCESVQPLSESLIKLKQTVNSQSPVTLPQQLKKLTLYFNDPNLVFPSTSSNYPPHLETLNLIDIQGDFKFSVPPITKYLSLLILPNHNLELNLKKNVQLPIYSITSKIQKTIIADQQQWLPSNTTHLTLDLCLKKLDDDSMVVAFRLDEIINHTNVRYLSITIHKTTFLLQFSIQRLDAESSNVLVLERQSLTGGIITQRKSINNQQQQYDIIYLYFSSDLTFKFNWMFRDHQENDL